jgi:hypothetical protein
VPEASDALKDTLNPVPGAASAAQSAAKSGASGMNYAGAISGGIGLYGAYEGTGGVGGALGGAMSGAEMGASIGMLAGPVGALIGAGIGAVGGAILGVFGFGGRSQAASWWSHNGKPRMDSTAQSFNAGQQDYLSAYSDMQSLDIEARKTTDKMGPGAHDFYNDTIKKAITNEEAQMTRESRAGRGQVTMSTSQFHSGGWIHDFGNMGTGDDTGFVHAMRNEFVLHPQAAATNAPLLGAMNSGLDLPRLLSGATRMPAQRNYDLDFHFHSPDAKGARDLIMSNKHVIRAALNDSYSEYSGASDLE